ncbi:MAG: glycosyltransferase family 4 protein [Candidatus Woesearchaeota archaeon]|nr:glycosyltransferase family 4 protein [Candidatus Aenigmarchaeota archaeon]MBU5689125.1 glycosyltransferase family 4 protein [Candidatus Aenigmarchaeota archaeon]
MKIGIIHPYQRCKGGGERICCYLAYHLLKKGFDISIFSDQKELAYPEIFIKKMPKVVLPKIKLNFMNTKNLELYKHWIYPFLFDYKDFDILIDTMGSSLIHAKINKKVKIFYFHFPTTKKFLNPNIKFPKSIYYDFKDFFDKISLKIKSEIKFACNSNYIKILLEKNYNINAEVIRPPVDTNFFVPTKKPKEDFILLTGRIRRFKKFELALKYLKGENVIIAGQINEIDYFNELKKNFPFVKFETNINDSKLKYLYQNCKAYIFTNWEEHFGIVPFEAMSCERKVIVPEFCGASELIEDGVNGFIVKKDFSNFNEVINNLLNSGKEIEKNARNTVVKNLSLNVFGKKFENLLSEFI